MRPYFEKMTPFGKTLTDKQKKGAVESAEEIKKVEQQVAEAVEAVKNAGIPEEILKKRGQLNVWERIEYLIDPGTWCPLHTLYNPQFNEEGTTGVIDGLAKINGKWAVVIGFNNKVMAGGRGLRGRPITSSGSPTWPNGLHIPSRMGRELQRRKADRAAGGICKSRGGTAPPSFVTQN